MTNLRTATAALLLATVTAEDFSNDAKASRDSSKYASADNRGSYAMDRDEDVVQEFLPKMSFSAKDYFREKKSEKGACSLDAGLRLWSFFCLGLSNESLFCLGWLLFII